VIFIDCLIFTEFLMKKLLLAGLLLALSAHADADVIAGRVVAVADGDTITVRDASHKEYKVRLSGIDAPEKAQPFGAAAKKSLSSLVSGKEVTVDLIRRGYYPHVVGKVLVDGLDVNLVQIERGMAWFFRHYQNEHPTEDSEKYMQAQGAAENKRVGLWADKNPTPPWEFRKQGRLNP